MENEVYEKDYRADWEQRYPEETRKNIERVGSMIKESGIMQAIGEYYDSLPKAIDPVRQEDYKYLLNKLDALAEREGGMIRGEISLTNWEATIVVQLPFFEMTNDEELLLLKELSERCDMLNITSTDDGGIRLYVFFRYFFETVDSIELERTIAQKLHQAPELKAEFEKQREEMREQAYASFLKFKEIVGAVEELQAKTGQDEREVFYKVWEELLIHL